MNNFRNRWACQKYELHEKEVKKKDTCRQMKRRVFLVFFASASIILYSIGLIYALDSTGRFKGPIGSTIDSTSRGLTGFGATPITLALILITAGFMISRLVLYYEQSRQ